MDFRGAVLRGWRLLILLGLVGAVGGFFSVPSRPAATTSGPRLYVATALIGPEGRTTLTLGQLLLDVKAPQVLAIAAAKANVGVSAATLNRQSYASNSRTALALNKKTLRGIKVKALGVSVIWYTSADAVALANALGHAVGTYIDQQAQAKYSQQLIGVQKSITTLNGKINTVNAEISGAGSASGALSLLETQKRALNSQLSAAVSQQLQLTVYGAKAPGYSVIRPAVTGTLAAGGKKGIATVVSHRSTRILGGLVVGLVVALGIILLVEVLDRSLRTVRATEEGFDLPVVAEIPSRSWGRRASQIMTHEVRLEVVVDPGSAAAEAYRRLHTAVLLEPLATEMALYGNGYSNGYSNGNGYRNGNGNSNGNGNGNGNGAEHGVANGGAVQPAYAGAGNGGMPAHEGNGRSPKRQVILVVSPGAEDTRAAVVANLAAVYAEAGAHALVVTMGNLQWGRQVANGSPSALEASGEYEPEDLVPLSTPSPVDGVSRLQFDQILASRGQVVTQGPAIITAARQVADAVLIDAPSLLRAHDAIALLPAVDVVLLVAQYAVTRSDDAREAGDMLRRFRAPVLGVAFTNVPRRERGPRGYGSEPAPNVSGVVLEGYDVPRSEPASSARLWL